MSFAEQDNPDRRIIAELRPREMWELVCASDRQYLLVGDSDVRNPNIMARFAPAISLLAFDGFKHLALQWREKPYQKIIKDYNAASKDDRETKQDLMDLMTSFAIHPVPDSRGNSKLAETFLNQNCAVVHTARQLGMQLHALGGAGDLAQRFVSLAGAQRAAVMFDAAQFKGMNAGGVDSLLPPDDTTYVVFGDAFTLHKQFENLPRVPDFLVTTDLGLVWATPVARSNGLINS